MYDNELDAFVIRAQSSFFSKQTEKKQEQNGLMCKYSKYVKVERIVTSHCVSSIRCDLWLTYIFKPMNIKYCFCNRVVE